MPVPKRRTTRSKKRMRSATKSVKTVNLATCPKCQSPKLPHRVCQNCGFYGETKVLQIEES
ncbi:50S ribosomal protein L32 [bacterium]|nr:50S ribosomal protein L32 [candidate division CSSED10-310 bacterium]